MWNPIVLTKFPSYSICMCRKIFSIYIMAYLQILYLRVDVNGQKRETDRFSSLLTVWLENSSLNYISMSFPPDDFSSRVMVQPCSLRAGRGSLGPYKKGGAQRSPPADLLRPPPSISSWPPPAPAPWTAPGCFAGCCCSSSCPSCVTVRHCRKWPATRTLRWTSPQQWPTETWSVSHGLSELTPHGSDGEKQRFLAFASCVWGYFHSLFSQDSQDNTYHIV